MSICRGCNQPVETNTEFCPHCGKRSVPSRPPSSNPLITGVPMMDGLFAFILYGGMILVILQGNLLKELGPMGLLLVVVAVPIVLILLLGMFHYRALALGLLFGIVCLMIAIMCLVAFTPFLSYAH
jgi:hypothetical protein